MFKKLLLAIMIIGVATTLFLPPHAAPANAAETITVAAGAGYKKMVMDLAQVYTERTGIQVEQLYGNMGQTCSQAKNSGLVDCVVGDKRYLDGSGLAFQKMHEIGRGKLVAAFAKGLRIEDPADIVHGGITRVAMPDPKKAIYGRAAHEFLTSSGIREQVRDKLLVVATVPQVSSYLLSKEVDVGFINLTDALAIENRIGGTILVDQKLYAPIVIVAGILENAPNPETLAKFARFLDTDEARSIARKHGL